MSEKYKDFKESLFKEKYLREKQDKKRKPAESIEDAIKEGGIFGTRKRLEFKEKYKKKFEKK